MSTTMNYSAIKKGLGKGTISSEVKSLANDPFVIKKVEEATETLKRVGFPAQKKK